MRAAMIHYRLFNVHDDFYWCWLFTALLRVNGDFPLEDSEVEDDWITYCAGGEL